LWEAPVSTGNAVKDAKDNKVYALWRCTRAWSRGRNRAAWQTMADAGDCGSKVRLRFTVAATEGSK
jgi:hypothetical protein